VEKKAKKRLTSTIKKQSCVKNKISIRIGTVGSDVLDEIRTFQPLVKYLNEDEEKTCRSEENTGQNKIDLSKISIPIEIVSDLLEAAELCEITKLNKMLKKVEVFGTNGDILAKSLRNFSDNYDMNGITTTLREIAS